MAMPALNTSSMNEDESFKEPKEVSASENTPGGSPVYDGLEKTDLELKTGAELQQVTQDIEIVYPGGIKLFLLASVTPSIVVMEILIRTSRY